MPAAAPESRSRIMSNPMSIPLPNPKPQEPPWQ